MKLISQKEAEEWVATGAKEFRYNRDVRLTPMARDVLVGAGVKVTFDEGASPAVAPAAAPAPSSGSGIDPQRLALFNNEEGRKAKEEICDIGRRLWAREYVDGNGGNISCRVGPNEVICTPTGVSKGFLKPDMLCMVDLEGNQLAGTWKRTSEITTHLAIYKNSPEAKSVVHAHPVHATAFAMAGFEPPQCLIPEIEVFVGRVPLAPYATPGSTEMAKIIGPMAPKHQSIMMGNHGIICWGTSVEDAYFKMEITDAYCRTLVIATHIPTSGSTIPSDKMKELLDMKKKMGLPDPRHGLQPVQLCEVDPWEAMKDRPCGCSSKAQGAEDYGKMTNAELESMVQEITQQIINKTGSK